MSLRAGKIVALGAAGGLAAAAMHVSLLIADRQSSLEAASHCDACVAAAEAELEFARLEQRVAAALVPGSGFGPADARLRYDALAARASDLDASGLSMAGLETRDTLDRLSAVLQRLGPMVGGVDRPEVGTEALRLMAPLDFALSHLAAEADRFGEARAGAARGELARLYRVFNAVLLALSAVGAALLALLARHARRLGEARDRLSASATQLGATSVRLAAANAEVSAVNAELQARNAALARRDRELSLQNKRFDAALDNMPVALCMVDAADRLVIYNQRFGALFGLDLAPIPGLLFADLVSLAPDPRLNRVHARQRALGAGEAGTFLQDLPPGAGAAPDERVTLSVSHRSMRDGGWVATYEDVSRRREVEARIAFLARHDSLTGLGNRAAFAGQVDAALAAAARRGRAVAVHCIDLDGFTEVNDAHGPAVGDALLREVGRRLQAVAGPGAVARLGGDEFAVLQECDTRGEVDAMAGAINRALREPLATAGTDLAVSASAGYAVAPEDAGDADALLKGAHLALAAARSVGRGAVRSFLPDMDAARRARRALEADLGQALAEDQFELFFQPLVDARLVVVTGFEALLRWRHPARGWVPPAEFVPVAEETGLIAALGAWALGAACRCAAAWPGRQSVAVNLSPAQFGTMDILAVVDEALARSGLDPRRLELEITESVPLAEESLTALHALRARGVRIAMDDFGTGYSSLSYLRRFPFDKIKIDQSFVRDLSGRRQSLEIVRSIAALGRSLGVTITAEGVETADQFAQLQAAGCDQVQGYHLGRPQPAADIVFTLGPETSAAALSIARSDRTGPSRITMLELLS